LEFGICLYFVSWLLVVSNNFDFYILHFEFTAKRCGGTRGSETSQYPEEKRETTAPHYRSARMSNI